MTRVEQGSDFLHTDRWLKFTANAMAACNLIANQLVKDRRLRTESRRNRRPSWAEKDGKRAQAQA
jgi:hypothetical protein